MPDSEITVSVIMLTNNHRPFIAQAVESVLAQQTDFSIELLIGDDASDDGTTEILEKYRSDYPDIIRLFVRKKKLGVTRNSYELLRSARGEFLACCEGDDYWTDPMKLHKQVDFLRSHPEHSAVAHDIVVVTEDGTPAKNQRLNWISRHRDYTLADFKGIYLPGHPSSLLRRNLFLEEGFDGSIIYRADSMINDRTIALIWAAAGRIYRMEQTMSCYRIHSDSVTAQLYRKADPADSIEHDLEYTLRLEEYSNTILKANVSFDPHKTDLLVRVAANLIKCRFQNPRLKALWKRIISTCQSPAACVLGIPWQMMKRLADRISAR